MGGRVFVEKVVLKNTGGGVWTHRWPSGSIVAFKFGTTKIWFYPGFGTCVGSASASAAVACDWRIHTR